MLARIRIQNNRQKNKTCLNLSECRDLRKSDISDVNPIDLNKQNIEYNAGQIIKICDIDYDY